MNASKPDSLQFAVSGRNHTDIYQQAVATISEYLGDGVAVLVGEVEIHATGRTVETTSPGAGPSSVLTGFDADVTYRPKRDL